MITKSRLLIVIVGLLFQPGFRITTADLLIRPRDTEALVDFPTFFNCSSTINSEIQWFHYPDGDNKQRHLVYGYNKFYAPYDNRCRIEKDESNGVYNLVINKVTADDFGKYQCQDDFGRGTEASAQLIVLESKPVCESNMSPEGVIVPNVCSIEPEVLQLTCKISFRGAIPSIVWTKTGSETNITEGVTSNISTNQVVYKLTLKPKSSDAGRSFECRTTKATTTQFGCTSDIIEVNGSNVLFNLVCAALAIVFVMWMVSFGFCIQLCCAKKTEEKLSKRPSDPDQMEMDPLVNTNIRRKEDEFEIKRLTEKISDMEKRLYRTGKIEYSSDTKPVNTTEEKKERLAIRGISVVNDELFAVFANSPDVDIYDSVTFAQKQSMTLSSLWDPLDIASCRINSLLYIVHQMKDKSTCEILQLNGEDKTQKLNWSVDCGFARLSTHETNVIVCASDQKKIIEYSSEGAKLHIVRLSPADGFDHIWYAMKVTGTHFLVSHQDTKNKQHRLCLVDNSGKILSKTERLGKDSVNTPICFTEDSDKSILVLNADVRRPSLVLLSTDLMYARKIMYFPVGECGARICLDETGSQLFVGANEGDPSKNLFYNGRISMYSILQKKE